MIKSEIKEVPTTPISFPCLVRLRDDGRIILFTTSKSGTIVDLGRNIHYSLGYYYDYWNFQEAPDLWEILPSGFQITLTQE